ncbi:transporter substrate-binding domain-containing protein [Geitlerinema sp. PCC 9228]|uniref:peptidoglycan-binding protein n=1 Tax=Geitlerinema sp. PCC 9228 TaxID=111611 RepID=UPI0008F9B069|nr:transporter substrate-binding domain-containing protein [Geitlerinema sp. PCC 9228]
MFANFKKRWILGLTVVCSLMAAVAIAQPKPPAEETPSTAIAQTIPEPTACSQEKPNSATNPPPVPSNTNTPLLQRGMQGNAIATLQEQLKDWGYFSCPATGFFGPQTAAAVRDLQAENQIAVDGIVGPQTWRVLNAQKKEPEPETNTPISASQFSQEAVEFLSPDIRKILERGQLIVAMRGIDTPPFFMSDSGDGSRCPKPTKNINISVLGNTRLNAVRGEERRLCGLDVEIAIGLAEALKVDLLIDRTQTDFNKVVDLAYRGKADMAISKLSESLSRSVKVRFSQPYIRMRQGLLVNRLQLERAAKNQNKAELIQSLAGQKIGVIQNSQFVRYAKNWFPEASIEEFPTWDEVVAAARKGEIMAAFRDEIEVKKIILNRPQESLAFTTVAFTDTQDLIAIALPWNYTHLWNFVNTYLTHQNIDYTADEFIDKYIKEDDESD